MGFQVVVCYGHPEDPDAFDVHYRATHIPLARRIPGLSGYTWGKCSALDGGSPAYYSVATLCFPDAETMHAGLASKEMREAGRDVRNFATGGVTMFTQEVESVHGPVGEA
ncbi:EthD family reductase [Prescottella agglutinans]|uniref:EthD family reductase n=1 Tax=Prescottella agglutinans TaxID=1644129 RepID=A0A438BEL7_9NOCA|nr:EthD family reductase [Prescottella agglutinans]RVW09397.1 EthD family reductase [Prescottella agglutinans]